jgi:ABC-type Fe3+-siderophore transport system permease subunit
MKERINTMDEPVIIETPPPGTMWKYKALFIGGSIGALVGMGAAYLLTKRAEQKGQSLAITPVKGVQLGVMLAGLLRSILSLGED